MTTTIAKSSSYTIIWGDCRDAMRDMETRSIDAVVCDPPYGLRFMGKGWDHGVPSVAFWTETLRVLKPGGHLLAFGGTRTFHRLTVAIEDAGLEIRDCLAWMYGQGFPKSMDIGRAIDKAAGAKRKVIGTKHGLPGYSLTDGNGCHRTYGKGLGNTGSGEAECAITAPATPEAEQWQGWGTALKPAWEPIILARKPLVGTVAANVLEHGTGAINVDETRIGTEFITAHGGGRVGDRIYGMGQGIPPIEAGSNPHFGRWPANVMLTHHEDCAEVGTRKVKSSNAGSKSGGFGGGMFGDGTPDNIGGGHAGPDGTETIPAFDCQPDCPVRLLDEQSGTLAAGVYPSKRPPKIGTSAFDDFAGQDDLPAGRTDSGGAASRFFYNAKVAKRERNLGLPDGMENKHPTCKPVAVMAWLCRLVTPPGGIVLDPFMGSGSTGVAAVGERFRFVGIELEHEYCEIARYRLAHCANLTTKEVA